MDWKTFAKKLIFPPIWLMLLLTILSAVSLTMVFLKRLEESPIAYIVYVVSFYTVCIVGIFSELFCRNSIGPFGRKSIPIPSATAI